MSSMWTSVNFSVGNRLLNPSDTMRESASSASSFAWFTSLRSALNSGNMLNKSSANVLSFETPVLCSSITVSLLLLVGTCTTGVGLLFVLGIFFGFGSSGGLMGAEEVDGVDGVGGVGGVD